MTITSLNSIQSTIDDLKQIVDRSQVGDSNIMTLMNQMNDHVSEMQRKQRTIKKSGSELLPGISGAPVFRPSV